MKAKHTTITLALALWSAFTWAQPHLETTLTNGWQFSRGDGQWQSVTVPHDWAIDGPFDKKWDLQMVAIRENGEDVATEHSGRSGSLPWIGHGVYKTEFSVPAAYPNAELVFDGAMADAHVYVNGQLAGHWAYGYNAFRVDVTPYIHSDGSANKLEVRLENLEESNRWYPGAGLYRPVKLVMRASKDNHLDTWGLFVHTQRIDDRCAHVMISHQLADATRLPVDYELQVRVLDAQQKVMADLTTPCDGTGRFSCQVTLESNHLWSPENPYLYTVECTLFKDGRMIDRQCTKTGIRTVAFDRRQGFTLNGVPRKIKGVCLHHDLGPLGAAVNRTALIRQITMMKEMGADAIRTAHNMPSTMQMEICDSLGMMVMAESFDGWLEPKVRNGYGRLWDEWWQRDITNLVLNHRNHPSIIMWSVGNEIPEQWKPEGADRYKQLIALCHRLDPSRMVTCGMDNPDGTIWSGFAQTADVPGYNYRVHRYDEMIERLPQGFLLGSETSSTVSSRGVYHFPDTCMVNNQWTATDGQCSSYDVDYCWWSNLPDDDWRMQDDRPWTVGEFVWTGFDYLGEPTPYDAYWPSRSSYFGICDLAGLPKDRYWLYRSHWNTREHTIHLVPHWTWPGREGKVTPVYCYTDYPEAELFVNGRSQGRLRKDTTTRLDRYRLRWRDVKYEPGEVKVVTYDAEGNAAGEATMRTAGRPARLLLQPERDIIRADGNDLAYVTVSLVDKQGTLLPDADNQLEFSVKGPGRFKAACNGDATSLEPFTQPTMRLFHGQLVVLVQSTSQPGTVVLQVRDKRSRMKSTLKIKTVE